jgi:hypothetical protein
MGTPASPYPYCIIITAAPNDPVTALIAEELRRLGGVTVPTSGSLAYGFATAAQRDHALGIVAAKYGQDKVIPWDDPGIRSKPPLDGPSLSTVSCPTCGTKLDRSMRRCEQCGSELRVLSLDPDVFGADPSAMAPPRRGRRDSSRPAVQRPPSPRRSARRRERSMGAPSESGGPEQTLGLPLPRLHPKPPRPAPSPSHPRPEARPVLPSEPWSFSAPQVSGGNCLTRSPTAV